MLLMYGGGDVVCFYLVNHFSNDRVCGCRATLFSGTYGLFLVMLSALSGYR